jgi:putative toxin-antitoxin system antitoxin component (TIGR02293 family)
LNRISRQIAPGDRNFRYRIVPRSSLARRQQSNRLSGDEGARLARLASIWAFALEVWKDEVDARDFLFGRHVLLEDRRPVDVVLESELGAELVRDILGGLIYGTAL